MNNYNNIQNLYEKNYKNRTDRINNKMRLHRFQEISKYIQRNKDCGEILDYGGGDGFLSQILPLKYNYNYLDLAQNQIKNMRKTNVKIYNFQDNFQLPNFHKKFDIIVLSEVIEHLPDCFNVLYNLKDYLKDDGIIICTTPNCYYRGFIIRGIFGKYIDPSKEHLNLYDYSTLINIFNIAGFNIKYHTRLFFSYRMFYHFPKLDKYLQKIFNCVCLNLFQVYEKK